MILLISLSVSIKERIPVQRAWVSDLRFHVQSLPDLTEPSKLRMVKMVGQGLKFGFTRISFNTQ